MLKEYYGYERFQKDVKLLMEELKSLDFEAVVGVARGGLTLSHALAEGLGLRDVQTLRSELYDGSAKRESITLFGDSHFINKRKVLVVDDIADSGETLKQVMEHLVQKHPEVEFVSVALFYKNTSIYEPHFWVNEAKGWIDFFWEADFRG
jgi:xanthine phosphoribosyltransferase